MNRRAFVAAASAATALPVFGRAEEPIIDIHQHQHYAGRNDEVLLAHQRAMGVTTTVILPSARAFDRINNAQRKDPVRAEKAANRAAMNIVSKHPEHFVRFANEHPGVPGGLKTIRTYLANGGLGIGESKFKIGSDSPPIEALAELAREFKVPVLMHFQYRAWNLGFEKFSRILKEYPDVNFIGHAQTWWGHIDKRHDPKVMYPKGPVTPGGLTDIYLREYPNMFADLSAGSGNNSLIRDEKHARDFLDRHQDKIMFGSDCNDSLGRGPVCSGARTIAAVRRLAASKKIERKILHDNAQRLLKLPAA
ncbi:MAG: amidohydrolase family protein [Limisphaerales bacterium]